MIDNPRLRLALATQSRRIVVALAILATVLVLLAAWTALTPATETNSEVVDSTQFTTSVDHSATVRREGTPWSRQTTLENHPAYLLEATPVLDLTVTTEAPPGATVLHDVRLELRVEREGGVVWQETQQLEQTEVNVEDGQATTETAIDVEQLAARTQRIEEQFAGLGGVSATIEADASYETERYDGDLSVSAPLTTSGNFYWISGEGAASEVETDEQAVERQTPIDWPWVLGLLALALALTGAAAGVYRYEEPADVAALRHRLHRRQFDEWISTGSVPPVEPGRDAVSLDSLPGLVDVAIDSSSRVVYDEQQVVYAVFDGDVIYYHVPEDVGSPGSSGDPIDRTGDVSSGSIGDDPAGSDGQTNLLDPFDEQ